MRPVRPGSFPPAAYASAVIQSADPADGVTCPMCGSTAVDVVEQIKEGVVVYGCDDCGATWADRVAPRPERADPPAERLQP